MILVAGGTGRLGTLVVPRLAARGLDVRVLTRDPIPARHLPDGATEIARGDVRDRVSIERAMKGVTTVVSAVQGFAGPDHVTPASVDRDGNANLVDVAAAAGADVVLMSVVGASSDSPMELFRAKHDAEQHLRGSGTRWTIVRATAFVELWAKIVAKPIVFGRGDNPINFVSVRDVAAVVERSVIDASLRSLILEVGGPQNITFNELAALLQEIRGRHSKIRHVPRWWRSPCEARSRNAQVAALRRELPLLLCQVRCLDGSHKAPVHSHWTTLKSPPTKTDGFQGSAWNPKGGEQVPPSAPHHSVGTDHKATTAYHPDGLCTEQGDGNNRDDLATHGARVRHPTPEGACARCSAGRYHRAKVLLPAPSCRLS